MKYLLTLFLSVPFLLQAQDCKLNKETDPYTKETKLSTGFIFLSGASVTVDADSKEIDMLFSIEGADKCFDNNSTAVIIFENSKVKLTLRNNGTMNCEGLFHFIFKNSATTVSNIKKISTQKITQITFINSNKKETFVKLSPQNQQSLLTLSACLVEDAKALIK